MVEGREEEGGGSPAVSAGVLLVLASIWGPKQGSKNTATTGDTHSPNASGKAEAAFLLALVLGDQQG